MTLPLVSRSWHCPYHGKYQTLVRTNIEPTHKPAFDRPVYIVKLRGHRGQRGFTYLPRVLSLTGYRSSGYKVSFWGIQSYQSLPFNARNASEYFSFAFWSYWCSSWNSAHNATSVSSFFLLSFFLAFFLSFFQNWSYIHENILFKQISFYTFLSSLYFFSDISFSSTALTQPA